MRGLQHAPPSALWARKARKIPGCFAFAILGESSSLFHSVKWGRAVPGPIEAVLTKMQNVVRLGKTLVLAASVAAAMAARAEALQFEYVTSFGTQGSGEGQFEYVEDFAFTGAG